MAEVQRASDGNDDYEFWKVCTLFISVHLIIPAFVLFASETTSVPTSSLAELSMSVFYKVAYLCAKDYAFTRLNILSVAFGDFGVLPW